MAWSAGDMAAGTGKTVIAGGATGTISGAAAKTLSRTLETSGVLTYTGTGLAFGFSGGQAGVLDILAGGEFNIATDGDLTVANAGTHAVNNAGILRKSAGSDISQIDVPLTNTGQIEVQAGNLTTAAAFTLSGSINASGGQMTVAGGGTAVGAFSLIAGTVSIPASSTFTFQNGAVGTGNGLLALSGGSVNINTGDSASVARLIHRRGTVTGGGTITVTTTYSWTGSPSLGGTGKTIIAPGATATVSGTNPKLLGRTIEVQGTLNYTGSNWQFGVGGFDATLSIMSGGVLNITGDGDLVVFQAGTHTFNNAGTVNRSGAGATDVGMTANNNGTINVTAGTLGLDAGGAHTGSFAVNAGATLRFGGIHSLAPASSVSGAGAVEISAGSATFDGSFGISSLLVNGATLINTNSVVTALTLSGGSLGGSGNVVVTGTLSWTAGDMAFSTGKTILAPTGSGTISGTSNKWLSRTLENSGTLNYTGTNLLFGFAAGQAGVLDNLTGAVFHAQNDGDLLVWFAGSHAVNNSGTFNRSGTGTTIVDIPVNNTGATNITAGTLELGAGGAHTGSFSLNNSTTLRMAGTHSLSPASTVSGGGTAEFPNGTATIDGALSVASLRVLGATVDVNSNASVTSLEVTGGSLGGSGVLTVTSTLTWSGGNMAAGTGKTVLAATGAGTISGASNKFLSRTLENSGTITYSGTNLLFGFGAGQAGVLDNLVGAIFSVTAGGDFAQNNVGTHAVNNAGTINRSGAGITNSGVPFNNDGLVNLSTGTLSLDAGGNSSGSFATSVGTALRFGGGTHTLQPASSITGSGVVQFVGGTTTVDGTLTVPTMEISADTVVNSSPSVTTLNMTGGSLGGTGIVTVTGTLSWSGGNMAAGTGKTSLASTAVGTISGSGNKWLSRTLENAGTLDYNGSNLLFGFGAAEAGVLDNLGTGIFTADGDGDFGVANAGAHAITNGGTFNRIGAGTTSVASGITFTTSNSVDVQAGTLDIADAYIQTGGVTILAAGTTLSAGGDVDIQSGSLRGFGAIGGNLINSGQVRPGGAGVAGTLSVTGDYTQTASGTLQIEIGGTGAGTFDVLAVTGAVTLDGSLNVALINSFNPALSDSFTVLTFASRNGDFASKNGLAIGGGKQLDPVYNTNDLTLVTIAAIPAPKPGEQSGGVETESPDRRRAASDEAFQKFFRTAASEGVTVGAALDD
jgi:hypothetical protein